MTAPYIFDEFFTSGKEESISPFLTKDSRNYAKNLHLRSAIVSALCLAGAFISFFFQKDLSAFFLVIVYFLSGTPALIHTIEDLKNIEINIDILMTLAAFLSVLIGSALEGALLLVLFDLSGALEQVVTSKAKGALMNLKELAPTSATILDENGHTYQKSVRDISVGTKILIKAGEIIPLDGVVLSGNSFVNLSHLTGESTPVSKQNGDTVEAGSRNLDGTLTIQVQRTTENSTLAKITEMINQAQEMKPKLQRFLDRFGKYYSLTIISLFFVFMLGIPLIFSIPYLGLEGSIYRSLAFLIAASPCALIIATPIAYLSAISSCAKKGVLLKGGITLDALHSCKMIAFDKTGTLTTGQLTCSGISQISPTSSSFSLDQALAIAASLEKHDHHPIAQAMYRYAVDSSVPLYEIQDYQSIPGYGVKGGVIVEGKQVTVYIGNASLMQKYGVKEIPSSTNNTTIAYMMIGQDLFAFTFQDEIRENMKELIQDLKRQALSCILLTGDHKENTTKIVQALELDKIYADLKPEDKLHIVSELSQKHHLAMVGDGINDAPALARATVGISLGQIGSASAIDASDIVFLQDKITLLKWLIVKAKKTTQIIKENLSLALGVIALASFPALLGYIPLWLAVILHEGGTLLVGLNSLRLLKK